MNLHGIVAGSIGTINPLITATVKRNSGFYSTTADGTRIPVYTTVANVPVQVQALTYNDILIADALQLQGVRRAIYLSGEVEAIVRVNQEGGDLIVFPAGTLPEGTTWLAAIVLESWPDWRKICITLQNGS